MKQLPRRSLETGGGDLIAYFGYGSLVNLNTLQTGYVCAHPARLKGWRRHWQSRGEFAQAAPGTDTEASGQHRSQEKTAWADAIGRAGYTGSLSPYDLALLSVHRDRNCAIGGMLVIDRLENLAALDERERLYERVVLVRADIEGEGLEDVFEHISENNLFVYVGQTAPPGQPPLLQSYLDTVMAGFLHAHGETGLADFIASTTGFARNIIC